MNLIELATQTQNSLDQAAARIAEIAGENAAALAAKDATIAQLRNDYATLDSFKTAMEAKVAAVLKSGDPTQYEALAKEFLTPAEEKARQETLSRIAALKSQTAALEAQIA